MTTDLSKQQISPSKKYKTKLRNSGLSSGKRLHKLPALIPRFPLHRTSISSLSVQNLRIQLISMLWLREYFSVRLSPSILTSPQMEFVEINVLRLELRGSTLIIKSCIPHQKTGLDTLVVFGRRLDQ